VLYKTAIYSFYLPVALVLLLCGFPVEKNRGLDPDYDKLAFDILLPLGEYFQIQARTTTSTFLRSLSYSGRSGQTSWTTSVHGASTRP